MKWLIILLFSFPLFAEKGFVDPWGKDAEMVRIKSYLPELPKHKPLMAKLSEAVISFHQNIISPVDGPRSHYRPSSSNYMLHAIRHHGFIKGYLMGCDRLLRENKETWVYRTALVDGEIFKWDPAFSSSKRRGSSKNTGS